MTPKRNLPVLETLGLPEPLSVILRPHADSRAHVHHRQARSWAAITSRVEASRRRSLVTKLAVPLVFASCLVVALVVFQPFTLSNTPTNVASSASAPTVPAAPVTTHPALRLADGTEFERLTGNSEANPTSTSATARDFTAAYEHPIHTSPPNALPHVTFEDGSTLTALDASTLVEPLAMTERDVTLRLARGSIDVTVAKGGSRKWTIEAGELSVEVVGTRFSVHRTLGRTSVAVAEGVVLVRSSGLEDGAQRLTAGERVDIAKPALPSKSSAQSAETLMRNADNARRDGDLRTASAHLQQVLRSFPNDPRTGVAAFQLALVTQQLGEPASKVVSAFEAALEKARGQSLRQDCYWRLVLALEHAGDFERAKLRARDALREYPDGRYASELRRRARVEAMMPEVPSSQPIDYP